MQVLGTELPALPPCETVLLENWQSLLPASVICHMNLNTLVSGDEGIAFFQTAENLLGWNGSFNVVQSKSPAVTGIPTAPSGAQSPVQRDLECLQWLPPPLWVINLFQCLTTLPVKAKNSQEQQNPLYLCSLIFSYFFLTFSLHTFLLKCLYRCCFPFVTLPFLAGLSNRELTER